MKKFSVVHRWLALWMVMVFLPFIPLYWPQILKLFSDTPDAYLCLVPVIAAVWVVQAFNDASKSVLHDAELNVILGGALCVILVFAVVWAPAHFELTFYGQGFALVLWPFWWLACGWLIFGVGETRWLWRPILFLFLVAPPIYHLISDSVSTALKNLTNWVLQIVGKMLPWVHWHGTAGSVLHHGHWIAFSITTACTGADSVMAVLLVLVFLLSIWIGSRTRKLIWLFIGLLFAIMMNWLRVCVLLLVLHVSGSGRLFDDVHALLGLVLFIIMAYVLVSAGQMLGMQRNQSGQAFEFKVPGRKTVAVAAAACLVLTLIIGAAWYKNQTNVWKQYATQTDIADGAYPNLHDYQMRLIGRYDDSSVLGAGAHSYAMAYSNLGGRYYRVEAFAVPSGWRLQQYGMNDCLTFHGDRILQRKNLVFAGQLHAHLFTVAIPPMQRGGGEDVYGVVTFTFRDKDAVTGDTRAYERIEISTPIKRNVPPARLGSEVVNTDALQAFGAHFLQQLIHTSDH